MLGWFKRILPDKPLSQKQLDERNQKSVRRFVELRLGSEYITEDDVDNRIKQLTNKEEEDE